MNDRKQQPESSGVKTGAMFKAGQTMVGVKDNLHRDQDLKRGKNINKDERYVRVFMITHCVP